MNKKQIYVCIIKLDFEIKSSFCNSSEDEAILNKLYFIYQSWF